MTVHRLVLALLAAIPLLVGAADDQPIEELEAYKTAKVGDYPKIVFLDEKEEEVSKEEFLKLRGHLKITITTHRTVEGAPIKAILSLAKPKPPAPVKFKLSPGDALPSHQLINREGARVNMAELKGKYTLLSFYFARCKPCVTEVPELNKMAEEYKEINYLGVTFDSPDEVKAFVKETGFTWPVVAGGMGFLNALGVTGYPAFALVNPEGKLVEIAPRFMIARTDKNLNRWLDRLIR